MRLWGQRILTPGEAAAAAKPLSSDGAACLRAIELSDDHRALNSLGTSQSRTGVARMARLGVRSGSLAFGRADEDAAHKRFERTDENTCERRSLLPCRRSWVRVPSSASKSLQISRCRIRYWQRWLLRGCTRAGSSRSSPATGESCLWLGMSEARRVREYPANAGATGGLRANSSSRGRSEWPNAQVDLAIGSLAPV